MVGGRPVKWVEETEAGTKERTRAPPNFDYCDNRGRNNCSFPHKNKNVLIVGAVPHTSFTAAVKKCSFEPYNVKKWTKGLTMSQSGDAYRLAYLEAKYKRVSIKTVSLLHFQRGGFINASDKAENEVL